jgi:hypothetical protein
MVQDAVVQFAQALAGSAEIRRRAGLGPSGVLILAEGFDGCLVEEPLMAGQQLVQLLAVVPQKASF